MGERDPMNRMIRNPLSKMSEQNAYTDPRMTRSVTRCWMMRTPNAIQTTNIMVVCVILCVLSTYLFGGVYASSSHSAGTTSLVTDSHFKSESEQSNPDFDLLHATQQWVKDGRSLGLDDIVFNIKPHNRNPSTAATSGSIPPTSSVQLPVAASIGISRDRPSIFRAAPTNETPKVFGVGLSKTGTTSLHKALSSMGLRCIHFDRKLLISLQHRWESTSPDLTGWYDDVDCVSDLPTAYHLEALKAAYPNALFIATHREASSWYPSFVKFLTVIHDDIGSPLINRRHLVRVLGSRRPDEKLWKQNYIKHYERVKQIIPSQQLLWLEMNDLRKVDFQPFLRLCTFFSIPENECMPANEPWPRVNTIQEVEKRKEVDRAIDLAADATESSVDSQPRPEYAYATFVSGAGKKDGNVFRSQYLTASMVWCQSIRATYSDEMENRKFDMVLLTLDTDLSRSQLHQLRQCFDRILIIPVLGVAPEDTPDTPYWSNARSKFSVFSLTEYRRVIAMDADQIVVKNLDAYFFRWYYDSHERNPDVGGDIERAIAAAHLDAASGITTTPRMLYAIPHPDTPVDSNFWSLQPSQQIMKDLHILMDDASFNRVSGWNDYGPVSTPDPSTLFAPRVELDRAPQIHATPKMYNASDLIHPWKDNSFIWNMESAWAEVGMGLYFFYLLTPELGGFVNPEDAQQSFIHFHGINKPWLHTPDSVRASVQEEEDVSDEQRMQAGQWADAMEYWQQLASKIDFEGQGKGSASSRHFSPAAFQGQLTESLRNKLRPRFKLMYSASSVFHLSPTTIAVAAGATFSMTISDTTTCGGSSGVTCSSTMPSLVANPCEGSISPLALTAGGTVTLTYTAPSSPSNNMDSCGLAVSSTGSPATIDSSITVTIVQATLALSPTSGDSSTVFSFSMNIAPTTADGTVVFKVDGNTLACGTATVSSGVATCGGNVMAVGSHTVSAVYTGGTGIYSSLSISDSKNIVIAPSVAASVALTPTSGDSTTSFTLTVTLSDSSATGTVEFKDGSSTLSGCSSVTVSGGTSSCSSFTLTAGAHTALSATYTGTGTYAGATASDQTSITISAVTTSTGLSLSPTSGDASTSFTLTATVTPSAAVGSVNFQDASSTLSGCGSITVSGGTASCSGVTLTAGAHSLSAIYTGTGATYSGATSTGTNTFTVVGVTLSVNPTSGDSTTSFALTATMSTSSITGSVVFKDGSTTLPCGTVSVTAGVATCSNVVVAAGSHTFTATFTGSGSYSGVTTSGTNTISVSAVSTTTTLSSSPTSGNPSSVFTLTATVTPSAAVGTVAFQDGTTTLTGCGSVNVVSGVATCSSVTMLVGSHSLSATYTGSGNYASATSQGTTTVVISPPTFTVTLSPTSGDVNTVFTVTAAFSPSASTGSVAFDIDGTSISSCTSSSVGSSGTATCTGITGLAIGTHSIGGTYTGSGSYAGASATASGSVVISAVLPALSIVNQPLMGNVLASLQIATTIAPSASTLVHLACTSPVTNTVVAAIDFTIPSNSLNSELENWTPPKAPTEYQLTCVLTVTSSADTSFSSLSPTTVTELVTQQYSLPGTIYIYGKLV